MCAHSFYRLLFSLYLGWLDSFWLPGDLMPFVCTVFFYGFLHEET